MVRDGVTVDGRHDEALGLGLGTELEKPFIGVPDLIVAARDVEDVVRIVAAREVDRRDRRRSRLDHQSASKASSEKWLDVSSRDPGAGEA